MFSFSLIFPVLSEKKLLEPFDTYTLETKFSLYLLFAMQLFEEKEYWEVFCKDTRNKRANGGTNKRNNVKEIKKRVQRMLEREEQQEELSKPIFE